MQEANYSTPVLVGPTPGAIVSEADPRMSENDTISTIPLAVLIVFTIFGNILVCAAFYLCRDLRNVTNYFVVSLAMADLLVGFVCMPFWFTYLVKKWPHPDHDVELYTLWICLDIVSGTSSIMNLVAISVDRFYAITSPFKYHLKLTKNRARFCIVLVWLYSIVVASLRILRHGAWYPYFVACASFFLPLPVLVYSYAKIFRVAHKQALKMRKSGCGQGMHELSEVDHDDKNSDAVDPEIFANGQTRPSYSMVPRHSSNASRLIFHKVRPRLTSQTSMRQMRRVLHSDLKAAKTLAIVMGAFIACWSPYIISLLIFTVSCNSGCIPQDKTMEVAKAMKWLHYSNSAVNPIIYTLLNRHFRAAFRRILCRFVSARRLSYVSRVISHTATRSSSRNSGNNLGDLTKAHSKTEMEILVCTEVVTTV